MRHQNAEWIAGNQEGVVEDFSALFFKMGWDIHGAPLRPQGDGAAVLFSSNPEYWLPRGMHRCRCPLREPDQRDNSPHNVDDGRNVNGSQVAHPVVVEMPHACRGNATAKATTGTITSIIHAHHKPLRTPYQAMPPAAIAVAAANPAKATWMCVM